MSSALLLSLVSQLPVVTSRSVLSASLRALAVGVGLALMSSHAYASANASTTTNPPAQTSTPTISHQAMAQGGAFNYRPMPSQLQSQSQTQSQSLSQPSSLSVAGQGDGFRLPRLSVDGAGFSEERTNRAIAQWSLQQVNASLPQIYDPWVVDFIYRISAPMNAQVRGQSLLAVPVIKDKSINAFAVTGGLIAINTGTISASGSLDETASVLAHEIAHLSQRHYEHTQGNKGKIVALQLGGLLAALAAASVNGDAATAVMMGAQTMAADTAAQFSREHEREADRIGMQIMTQAGYDARAMPQFFERLQRQLNLNQSANAFIPSFVRSHPLTGERLSEAHSRADGYSPVTQGRHQASFDLLKWRIAYLEGADLTTLTAAAKNSTGAKLALIARLADLRRFDEARRYWNGISALPASARTDPLFCITAGHIAYEQGAFAEAVATLQPCQAIYPERRDLRIYLADSMIYAGQADDALPLLLPLVARADHDLVAWDLLQRAYTAKTSNVQNNSAQATFEARALQARAKKELWRGSYNDALSSATTALERARAGGDVLLSAQLDRDIAQIKQMRDFKP